MTTRTTQTLTLRDISYFCARAGMMLEAGISPAEGMGLLAQDAQGAERELYLQLEESCSMGLSLADALENTGLFPGYLVRMVQVGEVSGRLDRVLTGLTRHYDRQDALRREVAAALRWPAMMTLMMLVVVGVMAAKVLPIFRQVYDQLGLSLSGAAAFGLRAGEMLSGGAGLLALLAALAGLAALWMARTDKGRAAAARLWQKSIFTRSLAEEMAKSRFTGALSLLMASGLSPEEALSMTAPLVEHEEIENRIRACQKKAAEGEDFARALVDTGLFSGMDGRMVSLAFRTGTTDRVLEELADRQAADLEQALARRAGAIEPALVAVFSVLVGLILLSVMLPLAGALSAIG